MNLVQKPANSSYPKKKPKTHSFHSPPTNFGFYAFPIKAIELFLAGHRIQSDKETGKAIGSNRKEFKYEGMIWHHLENNVNGTVFQRRGSWILTEFSVWEKAFMKESLNNRYGSADIVKTTSINEPGRSSISGYYSKDHYEVFIPHKV